MPALRQLMCTAVSQLRSDQLIPRTPSLRTFDVPCMSIFLIYRKSRHALADMKAGRVVQAASVTMRSCYDLQCTCSDVCTLQPYCTRQVTMMLV
jgi:hypothetical protein